MYAVGEITSIPLDLDIVSGLRSGLKLEKYKQMATINDETLFLAHFPPPEFYNLEAEAFETAWWRRILFMFISHSCNTRLNYKLNSGKYFWDSTECMRHYKSDDEDVRFQSIAALMYAFTIHLFPTGHVDMDDAADMEKFGEFYTWFTDTFDIQDVLNDIEADEIKNATKTLKTCAFLRVWKYRSPERRRHGEGYKIRVGYRTYKRTTLLLTLTAALDHQRRFFRNGKLPSFYKVFVDRVSYIPRFLKQPAGQKT